MQCDNGVLHNDRAAALAGQSADAVTDLEPSSIHDRNSALTGQAVLIQLYSLSAYVKWLEVILERTSIIESVRRVCTGKATHF